MVKVANLQLFWTDLVASEESKLSALSHRAGSGRALGIRLEKSLNCDWRDLQTEGANCCAALLAIWTKLFDLG